MNDTEPEATNALSPGWRLRLGVALVILAAFTVLFLGGFAISVHGWFETRASIAHWRARENAAPSTDAGTRGFDSPAQRLRGLERELAGARDRMLSLGAGSLVAGALVVLGYRRLRRDNADAARGARDR